MDNKLKEISELLEWQNYTTQPTRENFITLLSVCEEQGLESVLYEGLRSIAVTSNDWHPKQHLALIMASKGFIVEASYFAHFALTTSNGDVFARLLFAKTLWLRRLPLSVLFECDICRRQIRKIKNAKQRHRARRELSRLMTLALAYLGDVPASQRWITYGLHLPAATFEVPELVIPMFAAARKGNIESYIQLSLLLAPQIDILGPRPRAFVERGVRQALIQILRSRLWSLPI